MATLTLMPTRNNRIDYYEGDKPALAMIKHCSYAEVRLALKSRQQKVAKDLGDKNKTVIITDPDNESSYKNFINVLDEIQISGIRYYFAIDHQ